MTGIGAGGRGLLIGVACACMLLAPARRAAAQSVATELIDIMEANGQLTPEQAARLREKAALEREELLRQVRDEVEVQAEAVRADVLDLQDVTAANEKAVVHADLAPSMKIGGYVQFLASFADNESPVNAANGNRSSGVGSFETTDFRETDGLSMRRVRLKVSGHVGPRTKYVLGFDGDNIDDPGNEDALNFNDAYMEHQPEVFDGTPLEGTWVRGGQFYVPFSAEANLSSSKRLPVARSQFVNELAPFREPGVMLYNTGLYDGRLALYGGVFNGTGENEDDNDPFLWVARAEGLVLDGKATAHGPADWRVGAAVLTSSDGNGLNDPVGGAAPPGSAGFTVVDPIYIDGIDGEVRYRGDRLAVEADSQLDVGRFGLNAEFIWVQLDVRNRLSAATLGVPGTGDVILAGGAGSNDYALASDQEFWGFHVMPSYWIVAEVLQAYVKYEYVEYGDVLDAKMWGTTVGLNYHLLPDYRNLIRLNWVHLDHESDVLTAGRDGDLEQDFLLVEWQVKI